MSGGKNEIHHEDKDEDDEEEDAKGQPQLVPWCNPNEERANHNDEEAVMMEEGGDPFKEKKNITEENPQKLVAQEGIDIERPDMSSGPSRRPDVGLGAEVLDTGVHHPAEGTRIQDRDCILPGAFRHGGLENEEQGYDEDELTIRSHTEPPIPHTLSAELIDAEEEERRRQDDIKKATEEALENARKNAVVADVVPDVISKRDRRWKLVVALLLLVLIVVGVVLGITLPRHTNPESLSDFLSNGSSDSGEALRNSSTPQYEALRWLEGDANLANYNDQQKFQRYALATLYYSTKGDNWTINNSWLSDADVCVWYNLNCTRADAVSSLTLSYNNLSGVIPPEIGMLSDSLAHLDLSFNILTGTIPSDIGLLTYLEYLDLNSNHLTDTVPTSLASITCFDRLFLYDSNLTGSLDAFCNVNYEQDYFFAANTCGQGDITCPCCNYCCYTELETRHCNQL